MRKITVMLLAIFATGILNAQTDSIGLEETGRGTGVLSATTTNTGTYSGSNGFYNSMYGYYSGYRMEGDGRHNCFYGSYSGYSNTVGDNNVYIGSNAGRFSTGSGNVFIGYYTGASGNVSNKLYIHNSSNQSPLIYGDFNTRIANINGKLGINNNAPTSKLHIVGEQNAWPLTIDMPAVSNGAWNIAAQIYVNQDSGSALHVRRTDKNEDIFCIRNNGITNIDRLYATEIEVRTDAMGIAWPDYVFKADYKLRSLKEVEEFTKANSHLPEVPSANEMNESGINVAEMDALLLKKIEELTLYTIQQQKKIEELESKLNSVIK